MIKVRDAQKLTRYMNQYNINDIFTKDMIPFMELLLFKKGEFMLKEGEKIPYLLFLTEGKAKVFTSLSNGKSLLLCFYQGFKVLGDLEAVDSINAVTNVQAIEDTYCIGISYNNVNKYLLEDTKFLRYICSSLGGKLNRCSNNSSINLLYPLENRLASYIYTAGEREIIKSSNINQDKTVIRFDENLTEIAELLGTSYRHLLRTLSELCEKNIINKDGRRYTVIDEKTLRELSADLYQ